MNEVKEYNLANRIVYLLTYADNNAIGYFEKQGFIDNFNLHRSVYQDYIMMYDESLLMACRIRNDGKVWAKPKPVAQGDKTEDEPGEGQPKYKWVGCKRCQIELYSFQDQITHMEQEHDGKKGGTTAGPYAFRCLKCLGSFSSANLWKHKNGHQFENQVPKEEVEKKQTSEAVESTSEAMMSASEAVEPTSEAVTSTSEEMESTSEAVESTSQSVDSTSPAVEQTFEAVELSQIQDLDLKMDSQQGETKEIIKMPQNGVEGKIDEKLGETLVIPKLAQNTPKVIKITPKHITMDCTPQEESKQQDEQDQQKERLIQVEVVTMPSLRGEQGKPREQQAESSDSDSKDSGVEEGPQWAITCMDCNKLPCSCEMILPA